MPLLILLIFIAVPLAEIAILVTVGQKIGLLATILIVILTALIGTTVLRAQGVGVMARAAEALNQGKMPVEPVIEGLFLLIAGAFLLTPGLMTDTVGFLLLVPAIRMRVARWTLQRILSSGAISVTVFGESTQGESDPFDGFGGDQGDNPSRHSRSERNEPRGRASGGGPVIDGDFERVDEKTVRPGSGGRGGAGKPKA